MAKYLYSIEDLAEYISADPGEKKGGQMKKVLILVVVLFLMAGTVTSSAGTIKRKGPDGSNTIQKVYEDIAGWDWKPITGTESKKKTKDQKK